MCNTRQRSCANASRASPPRDTSARHTCLTASSEKQTSTQVFVMRLISLGAPASRWAKTQLALASRAIQPSGHCGSMRALHGLLWSQRVPLMVAKGAAAPEAPRELLCRLG